MRSGPPRRPADVIRFNVLLLLLLLLSLLLLLLLPLLPLLLPPPPKAGASRSNDILPCRTPVNCFSPKASEFRDVVFDNNTFSLILYLD